MKMGDMVMFGSGHKWVVAFVVIMKKTVIFPAGRYVLIVRPIDGPDETELLFTLAPEAEVLEGWLGETVFEEGEFCIDEGENATVACFNWRFVILRHGDGFLQARQRWQVGLQWLRGSEAPISFMRSFARNAEPSEIWNG